VLLIDDIQFMETRGETFHEEIFHTYNALHGEGKQIVLTSDRSPRDLAGLQERFRSRLLQGLVTEIDQPDLETRIAILRSKSEREGIDLPNDVAEWIAHRVRDNIRELEGSITMLRAFANLRQEPISLELAKAHLTNLAKNRSSSNLKQSSRWWPTFTASQWRTFAAPNVYDRWCTRDTSRCTNSRSLEQLLLSDDRENLRWS